jgi:16S rRNA (adenine1518-N6/adenine1519-N6)-dimethyltransferase
MSNAPALPFARSSIIASAKVPVRETLGRYGITPRKRFGQNFLHDPAVARRIVAGSGAARGVNVLEIGPGLGALTGPLLETGARVLLKGSMA